MATLACPRLLESVLEQTLTFETTHDMMKLNEEDDEVLTVFGEFVADIKALNVSNRALTNAPNEMSSSVLTNSKLNWSTLPSEALTSLPQ